MSSAYSYPRTLPPIKTDLKACEKMQCAPGHATAYHEAQPLAVPIKPEPMEPKTAASGPPSSSSSGNSGREPPWNALVCSTVPGSTHPSAAVKHRGSLLEISKYLADSCEQINMPDSSNSSRRTSDEALLHNTPVVENQRGKGPSMPSPPEETAAAVGLMQLKLPAPVTDYFSGYTLPMRAGVVISPRAPPTSYGASTPLARNREWALPVMGQPESRQLSYGTVPSPLATAYATLPAPSRKRVRAQIVSDVETEEEIAEPAPRRQRKVCRECNPPCGETQHFRAVVTHIFGRNKQVTKVRLKMFQYPCINIAILTEGYSLYQHNFCLSDAASHTSGVSTMLTPLACTTSCKPNTARKSSPACAIGGTTRCSSKTSCSGRSR